METPTTDYWEKTYNYQYKSKLIYSHTSKELVVLIGDACVGKTHLLYRYTRDELPENTVPTIGVEFATATVQLASGGRVKA